MPMNQMKNRLQGLTLLDRAFTAMTDDELDALVASLPDDHRTALDEICGAREGGFTEPATRTLAMRATAARGRLNGGLEQITTLLCDPCLADCIEALGEHSDNPTEDQLLEVTPALVEEFGLATTRLMLASSVAGDYARKFESVFTDRENDCDDAGDSVFRQFVRFFPRCANAGNRRS